MSAAARTAAVSVTAAATAAIYNLHRTHFSAAVHNLVDLGESSPSRLRKGETRSIGFERPVKTYFSLHRELKPMFFR